MVLEIVTPEHVAFTLPAQSIVVPTATGYIAIWRNHAPLITAVDAGVMWYRDETGAKHPDHTFAVNKGFLEVLDNKVTLFTETAERGDQVDLDRALAARKRAEERLRIREREIDIERAQLALAKAIARIRAAHWHENS